MPLAPAPAAARRRPGPCPPPPPPRRASTQRDASLAALGEEFGLQDGAAVREALAFWKQHQAAPAKLRSLEMQLLAAHEELAAVAGLKPGALRATLDEAEVNREVRGWGWGWGWGCRGGRRGGWLRGCGGCALAAAGL